MGRAENCPDPGEKDPGPPQAGEQTGWGRGSWSLGEETTGARGRMLGLLGWGLLICKRLRAELLR